MNDPASNETDRAITQAFAFLRDVIDDPGVIDAIPDGASVAIRECSIGGHRIRLVAAQAPDGGSWEARATALAPASDGVSALPTGLRHLAGAGDSAASAMDDLADRIRASLGIAFGAPRPHRG